MTGKYKVCSHSKCWMWLWQGSQWTRWQVLYCEPARTGRAWCKVFPLQIMMILSSSLPSLPPFPPLLLIYRLPRFCWNNKCRTRCAVICIVVMLLRWFRSGHTLPLIWCHYEEHLLSPSPPVTRTRQTDRKHKLAGFSEGRYYQENAGHISALTRSLIKVRLGLARLFLCRTSSDALNTK